MKTPTIENLKLLEAGKKGLWVCTCGWDCAWTHDNTTALSDEQAAESMRDAIQAEIAKHLRGHHELAGAGFT